MIDLSPARHSTEERSVVVANIGVMGGNAHLTVVKPPAGSVTSAIERLRQLERAWTRFSPDSELSRLNANAGRPMQVGPDTFALVVAAVQAWSRTQGAFDASVHDALIRSGYDRTFADIAAQPEEAMAAPVPAPGCGTIILDGDTRTVTLGKGVRLDPGGIGKGLAADIVAADLLREGALGACVNVGGDVRVRGCSPMPGGWHIGVEDPMNRAVPLSGLIVDDGGIASSGTLVRRWGPSRHHIIDPRTGTPTDNGVIAASVVAPTAAEAEYLTTAVMVNGLESASLELLDRCGAGALVTFAGGVHRRTAGWPTHEQGDVQLFAG